MKRLTWRSVLDCPLSLAGGFVALALSVGLLGATTLTITSAVTSGRSQPRRLTRSAAVAGRDGVSRDSASRDSASRDSASRDEAGHGLAGAVR